MRHLLGRAIGSKDAKGYVKVQVTRGHIVQAHRIIFLAAHGWEPEQIDHINRNRSDNRIENLRATTVAENRRNSAPNTGRKCKGVYFNKRRNRWRVMVPTPDGPFRYAKSFRTEGEAIAYRVALLGEDACF